MEFLNVFNKKEKEVVIPDHSVENKRSPERKTVLEYIKKYGKQGIVAWTLAFWFEAGREAVTPYSFETPKSTIDAQAKTEQIESIPEVVVYGHRDPETDLLLNVMTGKEDVSAEYKWKLLQESDEQWYEENKNQPTNDPETKKRLEDLSKIQGMDTPEYAEFVFNNFLPEDFKQDYKNPDDFINGLFKNTEHTFDVKLYETLWTMQLKNGNPKIRLQRAEDMGLDALKKKRAYYYPKFNTMYLPWLTSDTQEQKRGIVYISDWIAELSHAKQESEKPELYKLKGLVSMLRIFYRSKKYNETQYEAQLREYDTQGSVENEAHSIIEPQLVKSLFDNVDADVLKDIGIIEKEMK